MSNIPNSGFNAGEISPGRKSYTANGIQGKYGDIHSAKNRKAVGFTADGLGVACA